MTKSIRSGTRSKSWTERVLDSRSCKAEAADAKRNANTIV